MFGRILAATMCSLLVLAPVGDAWVLAPLQSPPAHVPGIAAADYAWTFGLARPVAGPEAVVAGLAAAVACGLGDLTGDGLSEILVQVTDTTAGVTRLVALASPDFTAVVWTATTTIERVLECAADLDLDGVVDPVLRTVGAAVSTVGGTGSQAQQILQTLSGATGVPLLGKQHMGSDSDPLAAAGAGLGLATSATADLLAAGPGAAAFVEQQVQQVTGVLPVPIPELPIGSIVATTTATASMTVMNAQGVVSSVVSVDALGTLPLALAPVPLAGGVPGVAALTMTAVSTVSEIPANIPKLSIFNPDGTLAWAVELAVTTGVPLLLPGIGDLDLDGIPDLAIQVVQAAGSAAPSAIYQVLSGLDGHTLLAPMAAIEGLLAVVPFGALPIGPALLEVERLAGSATSTLSLLDATGALQWSADIDAMAGPVNVAIDAYTRDARGFTDLTGDAVPDIAVASAIDGGLQVLDGLTGDVLWNSTLAMATSVLPLAALPLGPDVVLGAAGQATNLVTSTMEAGTATVALISGPTGEVIWTATSSISGATSLVSSAAGDLNGDKIQDLLVTASSLTSAVPLAGFQTMSTGEGGGVTALSGANGAPIWTNSTQSGTAAGPIYKTQSGPGAPEPLPPPPSEEPRSTPGTGLVSVLALVGAGWLLRRRTDL